MAEMTEAASIWVRAMYNYNSSDPSGLSLSPGDIVLVLSQSESGWWDGVIGDERGWFPSNYVVVIDEDEAELALRETSMNMDAAASSRNEVWLPEVQANGKIVYVNAAGQRRTELPDTWLERLADDGHTVYYENTHTGEISWIRPDPVQRPSAQQGLAPSASELDLRTRLRAAEPDADDTANDSHPGIPGNRPEVQLVRTRSSSPPQEISAGTMFQLLVEHGCPDLTSAINPERYSKGMVAAGGIGDIHRGELQDGTSVAIKMWRIFEYQAKSLKRTTREIYNWSKMDHDNVHKLLGIIMLDGRIGMVSSWMDNGDLQTYIRKNQAVNRYLLCFQVIKGVRYLHNKGIVHGDLKAVNILVSSEGVPKLTDFDHSIILDGTLMFSDTTQTGGGTARWMAPELHSDEVPCRNKQTDVYALGMTLLEIVTGMVPYSECKNDIQVIRKIDKKILPEQIEHFSLNERARRMWDLLVKCWNHKSDARPTADGVLQSLINLIERTAPSAKMRIQ